MSAIAHKAIEERLVPNIRYSYNLSTNILSQKKRFYVFIVK